jgi:tetratricopeptide (TPR) repeat protein
LCYLLLGFAYAAFSSSSFIQNGNDSGKGANQKIYSKNPEANTLYIEGLEYLSKDPWHGGSLLNAQKALELFRQAVKKDPQFALAYIGQADAMDLFGRSVSGMSPPVKVYRQEEAAVLKAAAVDDSLPQAHFMLARIYYDNEYDWPKAEKEIKRTIQLAPDAAKFHTLYSFFLGSMGRFEEAKAQAELAQTLDEKYAPATRALSLILYWEHQDDAAIAKGLEALKKDDNLRTHFYLGYAYLHKGEFQKGIEEIKRSSFNDADSLAALAYAYAIAGDKTELQDALERLKHHPSTAPYGLAQVYAALGEKDRAISSLEVAYQERSNRMNYLKVDPAFDPLRQEPRFKELMHKMNFE